MLVPLLLKKSHATGLYNRPVRVGRYRYTVKVPVPTYRSVAYTVAKVSLGNASIMPVSNWGCFYLLESVSKRFVIAACNRM